ncbi:hypothetical protein lpl2827 [Legionella pneumophila str. Lens]|uniref:Uncharacterized protein n=1 Tax=Legionella pneumophila (strain Lens) TaxID=297245 RepID=Q5WSP9_LEGPL|nr:hypothetical protein lpl2827 [Legionella pneumophila str. Lens]
MLVLKLQSLMSLFFLFFIQLVTIQMTFTAFIVLFFLLLFFFCPSKFYAIFRCFFSFSKRTLAFLFLLRLMMSAMVLSVARSYFNYSALNRGKSSVYKHPSTQDSLDIYSRMITLNPNPQ